MSRSYKKQPFQSICGNRGAKRDKILAHRGERRAHKLAIHRAKQTDFENFLLPDIYECSWNEVYGWSRDGNQFWQGLTAKDWSIHVLASTPDSCEYGRSRYACWPPTWYTEMMRK